MFGQFGIHLPSEDTFRLLAQFFGVMKAQWILRRQPWKEQFAIFLMFIVYNYVFGKASNLDGIGPVDNRPSTD